MGNLAWIDVGVIAAIMMLVTWGGHKLGGTIESKNQFFTANGSLPWWAVSSSIIATVVSSVTFISVPAKVFQAGGNLTYLQIVLGLAFGKIITAWLFAKPYYNSQGVQTTYDYIGKRTDPRVGEATMWIGISVSIVNTAVKLLTTSLVLSVMTDWSLEVCGIIIIIFSVLWSWLAGLKTVIWTDFLLFVVFSVGAVMVGIWIYVSVDATIPEILLSLDQNAKTTLFDFSTDPSVTYTIWAGVIGSIALSVAIAGGQGTLQRVRACSSVRDAKKAYYFAAVFYVLHIIILMVGLLLWFFYQSKGIPAELASQLSSQPDRIFPYFIMTEIPVGFSGVLIAAIFAAGISTLDSSLAEISDVSISNVYQKHFVRNASDQHYLWAARLSLVFWGFIFYLAAMYFAKFQGEGLLNLTFKLPNYIYGIIFGTILLARFRIGDFWDFLAGLITAIIVMLVVQNQSFSFFWWCPLSGGAMFIVSTLLCKLRGNLSIETTGIVTPNSALR